MLICELGNQFEMSGMCVLFAPFESKVLLINQIAIWLLNGQDSIDKQRECSVLIDKPEIEDYDALKHPSWALFLAPIRKTRRDRFHSL